MNRWGHKKLIRKDWTCSQRQIGNARILVALLRRGEGGGGKDGPLHYFPLTSLMPERYFNCDFLSVEKIAKNTK